MAPDFELVNQHRQPIRLSDYRGRRHVVLAFHPLAFTPVCSAQMQSYERARDRLARLDAQVLGISTDPGPSKHAWANAIGGISFELLSDFYPHGGVAAAYGVLREDGLAERAIFVVDKDGRITWGKLHQMPEAPDIEELVRALEALRAPQPAAGTT